MCQKSDRAKVEVEATVTSRSFPRRANRLQNTLSNSENDSPVARPSLTRKAERFAILLEGSENITDDFDDSSVVRPSPTSKYSRCYLARPVKESDGTYLRHRRLTEVVRSELNRARMLSDDSLPTPPSDGDLNTSDVVMPTPRGVRYLQNYRYWNRHRYRIASIDTI